MDVTRYTPFKALPRFLNVEEFRAVVGVQSMTYCVEKNSPRAGEGSRWLDAAAPWRRKPGRWINRNVR